MALLVEITSDFSTDRECIYASVRWTWYALFVLKKIATPVAPT
jgi:hypothetical protein